MAHNINLTIGKVRIFMLDLISAYENYLAKVKQASTNTIASYMRDIRQFSDWLRDGEDIDMLDAKQLNISAYLAYLEQEGRSAATVSRNLASLKNFYSLCSYFGTNTVTSNNCYIIFSHLEASSQLFKFFFCIFCRHLCFFLIGIP